MTRSAVSVVLDTNIVLDVFVFADEAAQPIRDLLEAQSVDWIATPPMRSELERILGYPQIVPRLVFYRLTASDVLASFDRHARIVPVAPKALITCTDPDDQCFIDLAVQHKARLVSKDRAVLKMKKRLAAYGAVAGSSWPAVTR
ncbi:MAG: putative toxin-antitoxin system toxin component, PIN family [Comamonadaceae bacterium]|nr:MAG: putative toxin-antitoxin system toxin component, PIN family [Comamonadaceae bacterium]